LTGKVDDVAQLSADDFRRQLPRFQAENLVVNNRIVAEVSQLAKQKNCSTSQIALAWVMAQRGVVPIPGTTKIQNLLINVQAESITLNAEELNMLNSLEKAQGYRYSEAAMKAYGFADEMAVSNNPPGINN
jgi:aryl-alcohol dehydrogenase-like predicted oxidoreductase